MSFWQYIAISPHSGAKAYGYVQSQSGIPYGDK